MGNHGWQGNPPRTESEARERIVAAATACLDRFGPAKTSLSDIATELGVTRQTVYRYFPKLTDILDAVALTGVDDFVARMEQHLASAESPAEAAIESIVFAIRTIPDEPRIGLLLRAGEADIFTRGVTSRMGVSLGATILREIPVDWAAIGVRDDELEGLAELLMRLFVSFMQHPTDPPRSEAELRALVRRWLGPALQA